jgi:hypothetical protein
MTPYVELRQVLAREQPVHVLIDRRQEFPLAFAEGFAPPYTLSPLGAGQAEIEQQPGDWPDHALLVIAGDARRSVQDIAGVELVARITRPETAYAKLLGTPLVEALLRATRPDYRMQDLHAKTMPWSLEVYRLP